MKTRAFDTLLSASQTPAAGKKQPNRKLVTFLAMLLSLAGAILLWFYVLGYDSPDFTKEFTGVTVTVQGAATLRDERGFTLISDLDFTLDVVLSGKKSDINKLRASDISAYIDISAVTSAGQNKLPVSVIPPNGTTVSEQSIDSAYLFLDKNVVMGIPITLEITGGTLASDLSEGVPQKTPNTATVEGPESELAKISTARAIVTRGDVENSYKASADIVLYDANGTRIANSYVHLLDPSVTVTVPVIKTKDVPVRVNFVGGVFSTDNAIITLSAASVTVRGTAEDVDALEQINVNIDEKTLDATHTTVTKTVIMPDGIENISGISSIIVDININWLVKRTISFPAENIQCLNLPEGYKASVLATALNVDFIGPVESLRYLTNEKLTFSIDFSLINLEGMNPDAGLTLNVPVAIAVSSPQNGVFPFGSYATDVLIAPIS